MILHLLLSVFVDSIFQFHHDFDEDIQDFPDALENPISELPLVSDVPRRSTRISKPPSYLKAYHCNQVSSATISNQPFLINPIQVLLILSLLSFPMPTYILPTNLFIVLSALAQFSQAVSNPKWQEAMDAEIVALESNNTWTINPLPPNKHPIGCKWVYRIKYKADGSIERYKAKLVVKGFTKKEGLDYIETFSLIAKMVSVKCVLAVAVVKGWFLSQFDVNNAFLHGDLHEEVYMALPPGFHSKGEHGE